MIGGTNAVGGGLNIKEYAISVAFPVGSTCTVTDGVKTFVSKTGAGGAWIFAKVYPGTWTVTITDGEASATATVEIDASNKTKHLDMGYRVYAVYEGTAQNGAAFSSNIRANATYGSRKCIDLSKQNSEIRQTHTISNVNVPVYARTLSIEILYANMRTDSTCYYSCDGNSVSLPRWSDITNKVYTIDVTSAAGKNTSITMQSAGDSAHYHDYIGNIWFD